MLAPITPRKRRRVEESVAAGVLYPWRLIVPNPIRRNSQNWVDGKTRAPCAIEPSARFQHLQDLVYIVPNSN